MLDHGQEQMLYGYIFVTHLLRLVLGIDQHIVQILADKHLATLYLRALADGFLHPVDGRLLRDAHFFK